jgi:hypothetical protein
MPTTVQGLRGTGQFGVDFRPKNYRELFTLLEPNGNAPLNALLAFASSESTDDPEYKNFRDELPSRELVVSGNQTLSATSITITNADNNKYAIAGSLVLNLRTGEVMQVTADTTGTTLAVTRGIGNGGTGVALLDADKMYVIGYAAAEGGSTPTAVSFDADVATNYCQIFRTAFSVTNTQKSTYLRTGDKLQEAMEKALKLHMSDIERAMFFGKKAESNGSSAQPTRFTGGLINELANVVDVGTFASPGVMSETKFDETLINTVFAYGSKQKIAFCGPGVTNLLQQVAKARWEPQQVQGAYGVNLTQYTTFAGDLLVHLHPQFRQLTGMSNAMVIVDLPYLKYRFLEGRDTSLLENRQSPGADSVTHEYLTECGLELLQSKVHTYIKGWNALA